MALLRQRSAEHDFVDDVRTLAEAFAADDAIKVEYPPGRTMKSMRQALLPGELTALPLIAMLSRDISADSTGASEEHVWLERLRFWCLIEFLKHVRLGLAPPGRLDEVAQKLRQCIDSYPEKREWANLFWQLRSPSRTHAEMHGHLKLRAGALGSTNSHSSAHKNFLKNLEQIDDPEVKAPEGKVDYDFQFARTFGRASKATIPLVFAPVARVSNPLFDTNEKDDNDPMPLARIVLADDSGQLPPPFHAVDLDSDLTPIEQERELKTLQLLSIEDQQRLPFTWTKPNKDERTRIANWIKARWDFPLLPDQCVAALMYLAAQTAKSVRLAMEMEVTSTTQTDWCLDPNSWVLHRLPPRRPGGAKATQKQRDHVQPIATRIVIELPSTLRERLNEWYQVAPAATLADLLGSPLAMEARVRTALKEIAPRVTPAMLGDWLAQDVFEHSKDSVLTHLASSNSRSALPGACAYASYDDKALRPAVLIQPVNQMRVEPQAAAKAPINCAGSELRVEEQWLRDNLDQVRQRVDILAVDPGLWLEYHNALTTYVTLVLLAATGGRPISSPFEAASDLNLKTSVAYIEDKVSSSLHAGRLVPLADRAVRLVRLRYLSWLKQLSSILSHVSGPALPDVKHLGELKEQSQLPFLFYMTRSDNDELRHLEVTERTLGTIGKWKPGFKANVFRHRLSTWLKDHGANHEVINGLLGHNENGTVIWGPYSTRCWADDAAAIRPLLNKSLQSLQVRLPRTFASAPELADVAKLKWPAAHLIEHIFGRQARQARQEVAISAAREQAELELDVAFADLKARNVMSNPAEVDRVARNMLQRPDGMPHPRSALRYRAFSEWVQRNWSDGSARAIVRRRYLPQLEEATPFKCTAPHAVDLLVDIREWYTKSDLLPDGVRRGTQLARLAAAIGLMVDSRLAATAVLEAVLHGKDWQLVRMNSRYFFEYSQQLSTDPSLPTMRWAISPRTAEALSLATIDMADGPANEAVTKAGSSVDKVYQELKRLLKLRGAVRPKSVTQAMAEVVRQANWQQFPGLCAAYLEASITSVGLDHSTWYRLVNGSAMLEPDQRPDVEPGVSAKDLAQGIAPELDEELIKRREGARALDSFSPALSSSDFISPIAGKSILRKPKEGEKRKRRKRATIAETIRAIPSLSTGVPEKTSHADLNKAESQDAARALFLSVQRALEHPHGALPSRRRAVTVALRQAISDHELASPTCVLYVDWIRSRCWEEVKKDQLLTLSSIDRYFDALAACFEQLGHNHDLTRCDEEEVTSFYVDVMNARRQSQASNDKERYKTWGLALSLLKRFHRFASHYYGVEDPDWSEIDGEESTLSISPRLVLEKEYLHALHALVGEAKQAQEIETTHGFMLILAMRFGLRGAEAAKLKQSDWLVLPGESRLVLVRNNGLRKLKTIASRRQVPLLFKLTDFEKQVIERHFEKLDANAERGEDRPLFPLLAINDNDAACKAAKYHISLQLKRSTQNPRVSLHSARHTFANMVANMLMEMPGTVRRGMFAIPPDGIWVEHVRRLVLCDPEVTRRSTWALARLMGHSHPRTSLRSYIHLLPEVTDALVEKLGRTQNHEVTSIAPEAVIDLDARPAAPDYLAKNGKRSKLAPPIVPTAAKALRALRMFKDFVPAHRIASACDLSLSQVDILMSTLAEVDETLARHPQSNSQDLGPSRLLSHIRAVQMVALIDCAESAGHSHWIPTEAQGSEHLEATTLIGPSRQIVLFSPAQFEFIAFVVKTWNLNSNDYRMVGARGLNPQVLDWAARHGFTPTRAEDFVYESKRPKSPKRLRTAPREKQFQLDSIELGSPPMPVRHRCVMLPAAQTVPSKWNSFELLLIVLVQLFLHQVARAGSDGDHPLTGVIAP
ncbi:MAG: hypothetical protein V4794_07395 [Pseudomonadota bacterium]